MKPASSQDDTQELRFAAAAILRVAFRARSAASNAEEALGACVLFLPLPPDVGARYRFAIRGFVIGPSACPGIL